MSANGTMGMMRLGRNCTFYLFFTLFVGLSRVVSAQEMVDGEGNSPSAESEQKTETADPVIEMDGATLEVEEEEKEASKEGFVHEMQDVVVTATRSTTTKMNTTVPVDSIRRADFERTMPVNVGEALDGVPGVSLNSPSGVYFTNPNLRGLGGRRVIMLLDGRRIDTEKTMGVTGYFVGMNGIERIEVVRGPGSVLYGSDALGGVVNIITEHPLSQEGLEADGGLVVGSNNAEIGSYAAVGWADEHFGFKFSTTLREANDYTSGNGEKIENSHYQDRIFTLDMAYRPHPKHTLRLLGDIYLGGDIGKAVSEADLEKNRRVHFPEDRHYTGMLSYEAVDLGERWRKLHLSGYFDWTDRHQKMDFYSTDYSRLVTKKNKYGDFMTFGSSLYSTFRLIPSNDFTVGADYRYKTLDLEETTQAVVPGIETPEEKTSPFDGAAQFGGGVFVEDVQRLGERWMLNAGLRWDGIDNDYPVEEKGTQTDFDQAMSGNVGVLFHPMESMSLTLNGGRAFRSPTMKEKFVEISSCKGDLCGNPSVRPETSWNVDAGLKGFWRFLTYEFYAFNIFITDFITLRDSDKENCQYEYTNIGEAWLIGGEGRLTFDFRHIVKSLGLKFWTNASYVRGEDRKNGDPLAQIPPFRGQAGLRLYGSNRPVLKRFYAEIVGRYNGQQERVAPSSSVSSENERVTGRYFLADALLGFKFMPFGPGMSVDTFLRIHNLADTGYRDHLSAIDGMGRNAKIGLTVHY